LRKLALPDVVLVPLRDLEQSDPSLLSVKSSRSTVEYYWTLTPAWLMFLFDHHPEIELLAYVDADMYFFGDPTPLVEELGRGSILALPSRYAPDTVINVGKARFNVSFNLFRRADEALACLRRWRGQCLEWCYERQEGARFGDQGYLDDWPEGYAGFVESQSQRAGLGPWNLGSHELTAPRGQLLVDGVPPISFHFSRLRVVRSWLYEPALWARRAALTTSTRRALCVPYARAIRRALRRARSVHDAIPPYDVGPRRPVQISLHQMLRHRTFLVVTDSFAL
jgi:hypothetical protein